MKNIIIALAIAGFATYSAEAQTIACGKPEGKVCKRSGNGVSCYKTKFAQNYKVCKGDYGYFICCEEPNGTNSTFPALPVVAARQNVEEQTYAVQQEKEEMDESLIPQSQSYPRYSANAIVSYAGYYPNKKGKIRVCENTNNVAKANWQAYQGCPTPAYDGPEKNKNRNVNVANPSSNFPTPPNSGNPQ